jgi:feruloyl esterase
MPTVFALSLLTALAQAAPCEHLGTLARPNTTITAAQLVPAGQATGPGGALPAHCRVAAVVRPVPDSQITVEIWMPAENWNGKFQAVGNGGWAGTLSLGAMREALRAGYATASTDTGHPAGQGQSQGGAAFALGHPEKVTDFAYRAVHEMTVTAKAIIAAYYQRPARLSYFNGCSTGGRQGMMEAQRFPEDYDGIVAGAPVYNMIRLSASQVQRQVESIGTPARRLSPEKITLLAGAVLAACDARDGVSDGFLSDPEKCSFNPATLACKAGDGPGCLTPPQIETVNRAYSTIKTKTGESVYPGSAIGFEAGLRMPETPLELHFSPFRFIGRQDARWDPMSFDLETDLALALKHGGAIEANDPNLAAFKARGGKLLLYHGWADPGPAPANTIAYYRDVERTLGGSQENWMRVFLMPGVGHCGGGRGPDDADFIGALDRWRESGAAPARIDAARVTNGRVELTRPLCPYPQVARYKGTGSTDEAANFVCASN